MSVLKNTLIAVLILITSIILYIYSLCSNIESTAQAVTLARHCALLAQPNITINDSFNLGVDDYAYHFLDNFKNVNDTCYYINFFTHNFSNFMAQRTYYFDKQVIQAFQNSSDYKQLVILGAGK